MGDSSHFSREIEMMIHNHKWPEGDNPKDKCQSCGMLRWEGQLNKEAYEKGLQDGYDGIPDDAVYGDTDSMLKLFCNECNKIVRNPIWDEETHGPYCPDCKTTLIEKSPDEEAGSK